MYCCLAEALDSSVLLGVRRVRQWGSHRKAYFTQKALIPWRPDTIAFLEDERVQAVRQNLL